MVTARWILVALALLAPAGPALAQEAAEAEAPDADAEEAPAAARFEVPSTAEKQAADSAPKADPGFEPRLHHAPVSVAEAHQPLSVRAEIDHS
jgi:hypothetical protein